MNGSHASAAVQEQRARQFARCTFALQASGRAVEGAEALFDQALTNGLAAIVAQNWPGRELDGKGRVLSAAGLLLVIEGHGIRDGASDQVRVPYDPAGPLYIEVAELPPLLQSAGPVPRFVTVEIGVLREAIATTQAVRHARSTGAQAATLEQRHVDALVELDQHPALGTLLAELSERHELQVEATDRAERDRAIEYLGLLGDEELERRQQVDYQTLHAASTYDDDTQVQECPVCWSEALVARAREGWLDEIGIGTCAVCGYRRSREVAEGIAEIIQIERAVDRASD